ncbi:nitrous oxide reductase family maturation protein NosD [Ectobacillus ponti]|uniref:Nitrous oxide reductase family maturation protein NosD n=2 Tax=Bacteria TaxID=2 RepID=A0AA41X903_9BACI|nr:nitrous oxide reductase family maturation protein NosD [Ectobacillus ponti]MCP8971012.1 nitrous oxide reductase family maturation protein NosD [Ectobacillus ponti]
MKRIWGAFLLGLLLASPAAASSSLQQLIDETPAGGTLLLESGTYEGNISITKPITIKGKAGTHILGDQTGNVVAVRATGVQLEDLHISGSGKSRSSSEEYAAVKVYGEGNVLKDLDITDSFHGIYLSKAHHTTIDHVTVKGSGNGEIAGQGNGLQIYYANDTILTNNTISGTRDGMFFNYSNHNVVTGNTISKTRYGLHYMYSDDNEFYRNTFSYNSGGAAIMNSNRLLLMGNKFIFNQGARSFGLLLQMANDITAAGNTFMQNQRGVYSDQSLRQTFRGNTFFHNDVGVEVWASSQGLEFQQNAFEKNVAAVLALGGMTDTKWQGNQWDREQVNLDLNQDGRADEAVTLQSSLRNLLEQNEIAYLFLKSPALPLYEKIHEWTHEQTAMAVDPEPMLVKRAMPVSLGWGAAVLGAVLVWRRRLSK